MSAGALNARIQIQRRVAAENARGENAYTFATFATVWAEANPKQGKEFIAASQMQGEAPAVFKIRFRRDVDRTMRVVWNGTPYEIKSPPVDLFNSREWLFLFTSAGTGDARKAG